MWHPHRTTRKIMKSAICWDTMPCSSFKVIRHFGGIYCIHFQGRGIRWTRYQCESRYLIRLIPRPWRWRRYVLPKRRLTFNGLQDISQKIVLFITTAVRISHSTGKFLFLYTLIFRFLNSRRWDNFQLEDGTRYPKINCSLTSFLNLIVAWLLH
jgi:hypothetical protein